MAKNTAPADVEPVAAPEVDQVDAPEQVVAFWRYTGEEQRVYTHVPVTVDRGDVIAHVGAPADDGRWEPHPGPITRQPDNTPKPAPVDGAQHASVEE
jgi:hypothetical protein